MSFREWLTSTILTTLHNNLPHFKPHTSLLPTPPLTFSPLPLHPLSSPSPTAHASLKPRIVLQVVSVQRNPAVGDNQRTGVEKQKRERVRNVVAALKERKEEEAKRDVPVQYICLFEGRHVSSAFWWTRECSVAKGFRLFVKEHQRCSDVLCDDSLCYLPQPERGKKSPFNPFLCSLSCHLPHSKSFLERRKWSFILTGSCSAFFGDAKSRFALFSKKKFFSLVWLH